MNQQDERLITDLAARVARRKPVWTYAGQPVDEVIQTLDSLGALAIKTGSVLWTDTDGESRSVTIMRAASTDMWPMGTNWWARDNALVAARLIEAGAVVGDLKQIALGKDLLLSALTIMSSVSQLERFKNAIESNDPAYRNHPHHWPHIFLNIKENLNAAHLEPWAHKQDAWQIVAYYVLQFMQSGILTEASLTDKHRKFLSLIVPFLAAVEYWQQENSGSWEEIAAVRTSVLAWETSLIDMIIRMAEKSRWRWLVKMYEGKQDTELLLKRGVEQVVKQLPYESPGYKSDDPRYREADAALIYLLLLDYPALAARVFGYNQVWIEQMEQEILEQVERLIDTRTGAIRRYLNDSYQGVGFFRQETVQKLNKLYGAPSGDASGMEHFTGRRAIVPPGPEAAWVHPVWQLVGWSARRFQETHDQRYTAIHQRFLKSALSLMTQENDASLDLDADGNSRVIDIPAGRISECYLTEITLTGQELLFPSPHTPLNWAVAEAIAALARTRESGIQKV